MMVVESIAGNYSCHARDTRILTPVGPRNAYVLLYLSRDCKIKLWKVSMSMLALCWKTYCKS